MLVRTPRHGKGRVLPRTPPAELPPLPGDAEADGRVERNLAAPGVEGRATTRGGDNGNGAPGGADGHHQNPATGPIMGMDTAGKHDECGGAGSGASPPAARLYSKQLVVRQSRKSDLPPPRWPPGLRISPLPYCNPSWTDGRLEVRQALYGSRAIRLVGVIDKPQRLLEVLVSHARATHGSPRLTAAWRSPADVHRFLCHSEPKQALEGPYRLRCPDTSPLVLQSAEARRGFRGADVCGSLRHGAGAGAGGRGADSGADGGADGGRRPTLAEALQCLESWQQHRVLIQLDLCNVLISHERSPGGPRGGGGGADGGSGGRGGAGSSSSSSDPERAGRWNLEFACCVVEGCSGSSRDGDSGSWMATCKGLLSPVLTWIRQELLGRYWGQMPDASSGWGDGGEHGLLRELGEYTAVLQRVPLQLPYSAGTLSLEWGSAGALLPLRYQASDDRVLIQVGGRRRVLLVPPEHAMPALAPFPVLHPYDGYSMPAIAHTLVYDTPGVDIRRAAATVLSAWPNFHQANGYVTVLEPGDGLFIPAGWFLHSELLLATDQPIKPPQRQNQAYHVRSQAQPSGEVVRLPLEEVGHNIALVLSLAPMRSSSTSDPHSDPSVVVTANGTVTQTAACAQDDAKPPPALAALTARLPPAGTVLLQLSRLLESWLLAVEVPPGPELRKTLLEMAEYHALRRRLECRRQRGQLLSQPPQPSSLPQGHSMHKGEYTDGGMLDLNGSSCASGDDGGGNGTGADGEPRLQEHEDDPWVSGSRVNPADPRVSSAADCAARWSLSQQWVQLQLHPMFNSFTPRGRVLLELYDMVVLHVAPVARRALMVARTPVMRPPPVGEATHPRSTSEPVHRRGETLQQGSRGDAGCSGGGTSGSGNEQSGDGRNSRCFFGAGGEMGSITAKDDDDDDDDRLDVLLRLVCQDRLLATDWVNQVLRMYDERPIRHVRKLTYVVRYA
ncbi:hypothetical protein Vafri_15416 [Volvox africanus]|uniref:JmjC domain-containing protein n=1 Tax=Volvox africanus TaxID=51714 RepID=A0A8J4F4Q0_9CHLO|nr:hypothetical protein Vafri_15416 [Volvox africanus]